MMRVLVTGTGGQVGGDVARLLAGRAELFAHDRSTLDLAVPGQVEERMREARPHLVINAAAYTAVDRAESEPDAARAVNAVAPGVLGEAARRCGALVVHYSTDYVYDGCKQAPYVESDATAPLSVYGRTKLEGERALEASGAAHVILRTSWVYAPRGRNFLLTMLRLAASRDEVRVVDDQFGAPTSSLQLARATLAHFTGDEARALQARDVERVARQPGVYHASAAGSTTWCGFARAIFEGCSRRDPAFRAPRVVPITTAEYPTPARRPANSVLSNARLASTFGVRLGSWESGLAEALSALPGA